MKDLILKLYGHLVWADALALAAVGEARTSGPALNLMSHVLGAEAVWLARLEGKPQPMAVWPELSVAECEALSSALRAAFGAYIAAQTEESLGKSVRYRNSAGTEFETRIDDILTHVALHGAYHRGQVALALRQESARPNPTDYIAYVRGSPAATRADDRPR